jgi:hypothetical protein
MIGAFAEEQEQTRLQKVPRIALAHGEAPQRWLSPMVAPRELAHKVGFGTVG